MKRRNLTKQNKKCAELNRPPDSPIRLHTMLRETIQLCTVLVVLVVLAHRYTHHTLILILMICYIAALETTVRLTLLTMTLTCFNAFVQ